VSAVARHSEKWPNGKLKSEWSTARANDGRTLLEGVQTFYYETGEKQWTANFHLGRKIGDEVFHRADGSKAWTTTHGTDGTWTWRLFDDSGKQTAESHWHDKTLLDANFADAKP
jgi:antitoxin component YwqK of YwqJK toxin-antitoxin module